MKPESTKKNETASVRAKVVRKSSGTPRVPLAWTKITKKAAKNLRDVKESIRSIDELGRQLLPRRWLGPSE